MSTILDSFTQEEVKDSVASLKALLSEMKKHRVFPLLQSMDDLRIFMGWHVFAVWDFMTLAKRLQFEYTTLNRPWTPPKCPGSARHINEIILAEETDEDGRGGHCSHYELYLRAMAEVGAPTTQVEHFVSEMTGGSPARDAMIRMEVPKPIQAFVEGNLKVAFSGSREEVLGNFIFGREDSIPGMFQNLLDNWGIRQDKAPSFVYYLKRHIELDGESHGPASCAMLLEEVGGDIYKIQRALDAGIAAVNARITLWDALADKLIARR